MSIFDIFKKSKKIVLTDECTSGDGLNVKQLVDEDPENKPKDLVTVSENDFQKAVDPVKIESTDEMFLFKCKKCGNVHFRHAGYVEMLLPYVRADKEKRVDAHSYQVKVCTNCRNCYIWYLEQMYDVTKHIDLLAWEKTEKDMQKATGPGGDC